MPPETRGRKPINKKDVKNVRFQIALSENQIEAVGSKEQVYELLHKTIENVKNN